jgi:predicted RNA-binding protein with PIN domain
MRWLIDGYNVMHAGGRLGPRLGREGFRRARRRFLDELVATLGLDQAERTTVVFDASVPPGDFPLETTYRGLKLAFALGDDDADTRIERMIAQDSNPRTLMVISSDRRIRQAAARRRSRQLTADAFWDLIDDLKKRPARDDIRGEVITRPPLDREVCASPEESALWLETFRELAESAEIREVLASNDVLLSDRDLTEIQRQVDREP